MSEVKINQGLNYYQPITKIPYEQQVENKIRNKYTLGQELAIQRQRDTKPQEFKEYFNYCELCKAEVKEEINKHSGGEIK